MNINDYKVTVSLPWGEEVEPKILHSNFLPVFNVPPEIDHSAFYQYAATKVVPPKLEGNISFTIENDTSYTSFMEWFKKISKKEKYYVLYSLKSKGCLCIFGKNIVSKNKKKIISIYKKLKKLLGVADYIKKENVVVKPVWI